MERKFIVVEPLKWYCWIGCLMSILNHFLMTSFSTKDTFDVLKLVKYHWKFQPGQTADDLEIAYFLSNLWFRVEFYLDKSECLEKYATDPKKYLQENNITQYPEMNMTDSSKITKKILEDGKIGVVYDENLDIYNLIEKRQARNTLFLVWWDYYTLRNEKRESGHSGHYVVCSGVQEGKFLIHDPGPDIAFEYFVDIGTMKKAMQYYWNKESLMIITYI